MVWSFFYAQDAKNPSLEGKGAAMLGFQQTLNGYLVFLHVQTIKICVLREVGVWQKQDIFLAYSNRYFGLLHANCQKVNEYNEWRMYGWYIVVICS